jgi:hypothetical protein
MMAKIRKELKSIETTGIHKAIKEEPAKAHKLGVTFFYVKFCSQIINKVI